MRLKRWPWRLLVLAVKPEHAGLHRRLQALLEAEGIFERRAASSIVQLERMLEAKRTVARKALGCRL